MMELAQFLRKPTEACVFNYKILSTLVLQRLQVRTFASKKPRAKSKKPTVKRKTSKKVAAIDVDALSKNLPPFSLDKGQQTLPTRPIVNTPNRVEKDGKRLYRVQSDDENCTFPSVTNVLSYTKPRSFNFAVKTWYQSQVKELGEEGAEKMKRENKLQGENFHKVNILVCYQCCM